MNKQYHYEFGCAIADNEDDEEFKQSTISLDLRNVVAFMQVRNHEGPGGVTYKSVTDIQFGAGYTILIYYPYNRFKKLYEDVIGVDFVRMPYPSEAA